MGMVDIDLSEGMGLSAFGTIVFMALKLKDMGFTNEEVNTAVNLICGDRIERNEESIRAAESIIDQVYEISHHDNDEFLDTLRRITDRVE